MILAQYSVKVQSDMSPQAQFMPMVTLYYVFSISYAFVSLFWFIIANNWTVKTNIPPNVSKFAFNVKKVLFWIFDEPPFWRYFCFKKDKNEEKEKLIVLSGKPDRPSSETSQPINILLNDNSQAYDISKDLENKDTSQEKKEEKPKCNYCNFCENCQKDKTKEKDKKKKKDATESDISALNYVACFCMILFEFSGNTIVWLMISNPPPGY